MNRFFISISIILTTLTAIAQDNEFNYSKDYNTILSQSKDSTSNFFYPKLLERFQKNDSTLTNKDVLSLMIGFTANEYYKPYKNTEKEKRDIKINK